MTDKLFTYMYVQRNSSFHIEYEMCRYTLKRYDVCLITTKTKLKITTGESIKCFVYFY